MRATSGPVVVGAVAEFSLTLDLAAGDSLAGKDVTVSIRSVEAPAVPVDATLEGVTATVSEGVLSFTLTNIQTALLEAPSNIMETSEYYVEVFVGDDHWIGEEPLWFKVRNPAAAL